MRQFLFTALATAALLLTALSPAHAGQPVRELHDQMVKKPGRILFQGRVDPGHGPVVIQKKACSSPKCPWRTYKTVQTHGDQHRWQVRVYAPRQGSWYWRGYVDAYGGYARSWTAKWRTYVS